MGQLRPLNHLLLAQGLMLVLRQIEDVHFSIAGDGCEDRGGVRRPSNVPDGVPEVEGQDRVREVVVPDLHRPVGRAGNEHSRMERIPFDGIHRHVMALVGLQILSAVRLGALVDLPLLRTDDEQMLVVLVEVEAAAARSPTEVHFIGVVLGGGYEFELHDGLHLKLVLAHNPRGDLAVRGDREEVQLLGEVFFLPVYLPHGVRVLASADGRGVDRLVRLVAHVVHHNRAVVAADRE